MEKSDEELLQEVVQLIQSQNFTGTEEEITVQQITFLDKYIKENVNFDFNTLSYDEESSENNVSFKNTGVLKNGKAVCSGICSFASDVLTELGIDNAFVKGNIKGMYNHEWNLVTIDGKDYMVDFTLSLCAFKYDEKEYDSIKFILPKPIGECEYLFFDMEKLNELEVSDIVVEERPIPVLKNGKTVYMVKKQDGEDALKRLSKVKSLNLEDDTKKDTVDIISQTFGVDVSKVRRVLLESGIELFSFYDSGLGRTVLLKNETKGESLQECLEEYQRENSEFQTDNEEKNTHNILMDQKKNGLELEMYTKEDFVNHPDIVDGLDKISLQKLNYLLKNYDRLHIKSINVENSVYLDENDNIFEVSVNEKAEIFVSSAADETSSSIFEEKEDLSKNEVIDMIQNEKDTFQEKEDLLEKEDSPKVYTYRNQNDGHVDITLFFVIIAFLIVIAIVYMIVWQI